MKTAQKKTKPVLDWRIPKGFKGEIDADKFQLASVFQKFWKREIDNLVEIAKTHLDFVNNVSSEREKLHYLAEAWAALFPLNALFLMDSKASKLWDKLTKTYPKRLFGGIEKEISRKIDKKAKEFLKQSNERK